MSCMSVTCVLQYWTVLYCTVVAGRFLTDTYCADRQHSGGYIKYVTERQIKNWAAKYKSDEKHKQKYGWNNWGSRRW
jgi:hypothetical protein